MVVGDNEVALSLEVDPAGQRVQVRRAALASSIGTTIEWYDFFLYNTAAALVFPAPVLPCVQRVRGRDASFATYVVGFAARPIGAAIFGHWGDRIGRKTTLIITLLVMGISFCDRRHPARHRRDRGRRAAAAGGCCACCKASRSAASGAGRCCSRWNGVINTSAVCWAVSLSSASRSGLVLGTGGMTLLSATMSARRSTPGAGGCRSWPAWCWSRSAW